MDTIPLQEAFLQLWPAQTSSAFKFSWCPPGPNSPSLPHIPFSLQLGFEPNPGFDLMVLWGSDTLVLKTLILPGCSCSPGGLRQQDHSIQETQGKTLDWNSLEKDICSQELINSHGEGDPCFPLSLKSRIMFQKTPASVDSKNILDFQKNIRTFKVYIDCP